MKITVVEGDITRQDVDAVVNAANKPCAAAVAWTVPSTGPAAGPSWRTASRAFRTASRPVTPAGPPPATCRLAG